MALPAVPIDTRSLFKPLDQKLISLLDSLEPADWEKQTVAKHWTVKDVASHLLDGSLRTLSMQRDRYSGESPPNQHGYSELVNWLNSLNAEWVNATKRLSPQVLILLLKSTGNLVSDYYESLDPLDEAVFPVNWAGESTSKNWMHVAREYTEKWHHQQQIRDATNREGILGEKFFLPVMDTFFQALPHHFRDVTASDGVIIEVTVSSLPRVWLLKKVPTGWRLVTTSSSQDVSVQIPAETSWKLFTKSWRPAQVMDKIVIKGKRELGMKVLEMVSVMA